MARFLHHARRALRSLPSPNPNPNPNRTLSHVAEMRRSAFRDNILRIIRTEIDYNLQLRPPREPIKEFNAFMVDERPGQQYVRLTKKFGEKEDIRVDVTMFDGYTSTSPNVRSDDDGGDVKLHASLVVDVMKGGDANNVLQFICSAWPDALIIQKVFPYQRSLTPLRPFIGPDFKELDDELQEALMSYLGERGINDDFAAFLHYYIANKDVCEHLRWMGRVKTYIEK